MNLFFAAACSNPNDLICSDSLPQAQANAQTLRTIFLVAFVIIGALALLFMVIAGTRYALSKGEPDNIQKAKNEMKYSAIGLIIAASAAAVVNLVLDRLKS